MSNENYVNQELEFEQKISSMGDRQLLEFVARQNYETNMRCIDRTKRIVALENESKKISGVFGGVAGTIASVIIGVISYFSKGN